MPGFVPEVRTDELPPPMILAQGPQTAKIDGESSRSPTSPPPDPPLLPLSILR